MKSLKSFVLNLISIPQQITSRRITITCYRTHARMNQALLKSDENSPSIQDQPSHSLLRYTTTLSYHTALSFPSDDNDQVSTLENDNNPQHRANMGDVLAIVLPKEWQDFNLNKKDEANRIDPSMFDGILNDSMSSTSCHVDCPNGYPFDSIVDTTKMDPNDLIVSLDMSMNVVQEEIYLHMNRKATEDASRTFSRLELSAANRISSILNPRKAGTGKAGRKQKQGIGNKDFLPRSNIYVYVMRDGDGKGVDCCGEATSITRRSINVEQCTIRELCETLAMNHENGQSHHERDSIVLSLFIPMVNDTPVVQSETVIAQPELKTLSVDLTVTTNPPSILSIQTFESFGSKLFTGVPVVIQTTLIHASRAQISWFVDQELALYDSHCFIPKKEHVGKILSVVITPLRDGYHEEKPLKEAYRFDNAIDDIPYMPIVSPLRDDFNSAKNFMDDEKKDLVRVMTYNILADLYVSREIDDETVMFPHVKYEHIRKTRRMPMIVAEILAYKADIVCLQEVDGAIYDTYFEPVMKAIGYDAFYSNKVSCQREGCAMFWCKETFEIDEAITISLRDLFDPDKEEQTQPSHAGQDAIGIVKPNYRRWDSMRGIKNLLKSHPELRRVTMEKIGQILQVVKLKVKVMGDSNPKKIVVGNTHLFYHPMADHIRAMQTYVVCKKIDEVRRSEVNVPPYPLILCGDFNSDPLSGASQLLFSRSVEPDHHDCWKHLNEYQWDMGNNSYMLEHQYIGNSAGSSDFKYEYEEFQNAVEDIKTPLPSAPALALPESFPQLVSGCEEMPAFTNYAVDFVDTLDYVLASKVSEHDIYGFVPIRSAMMPTFEEIKRFVAMPNEFMPSDHVSIVADFQWIKFDKSKPA
mmetsp:Transcript_11160/g.20892  ORF Transcript_11160/g.20892 Transcript_11160/m.20892 type:complete len:865 (-) Transcript_11160:2888-5482(-)